MRNDLGHFQNSMVHWTMQAVECYRNGCNCLKCTVKNQLKSQKCQMKATVIEIVKRFGKPKNEIVKGSFVKNGKRYYFDGEGKDDNCLSESGQDNG